MHAVLAPDSDKSEAVPHSSTFADQRQAIRASMKIVCSDFFVCKQKDRSESKANVAMKRATFDSKNQNV